MANKTTPAAKPNNDRLDAFVVDEFEVDGEKRNTWNKIGSAWPHQDGAGYRLVLKAIPVDGVVILRKPEAKEG